MVQRLALAVAMSATPDPATAFAEAESLLGILKPGASNNPETVELWAVVAKGLWDTTRDRTHLESAVQAYERGFCLRQDYANGLNYALVLNVRAAVSAPADAIADFVQARRVRRRVVEICRAQLQAESPAPAPAGAPSTAETPGVSPRYALRAALAEAYLGLEDRSQSDRWRDEAFALTVPPRVKEATAQRMATVSALVEQSPLRFLSV
jgi:hypothetical protein